MNLDCSLWFTLLRRDRYAKSDFLLQLKDILQRQLPDSLKLSIAKQIENNLFAKVLLVKKRLDCNIIIVIVLLPLLQISFLVGLRGIGEIRTLFSAEVRFRYLRFISTSGEQNRAV